MAVYPPRVAKMSGNVSKLKPKQEEAIIALLTNRSVEDAARVVKVAPRTLYRWLNETFPVILATPRAVALTLQNQRQCRDIA